MIKTTTFKLLSLITLENILIFFLFLLTTLIAFYSMDTIYLVDSNQDSTSGKWVSEHENKVQKFMSAHTDTILSDLRENIEKTTNPETKEELEQAYYNEVDFKVEVESSINKAEIELNDNNQSSSSENKKRDNSDLDINSSLQTVKKNK